MRWTIVAPALALLFCSGAAALAQDYKMAVVVDPGGRTEAEGAQRYLALTRAALDRAGAVYDLVTQEQMVNGVLDPYAVAVVPYAPNLRGAGLAALQAFCGDGGKVMCFYRTYGLDADLGLRGSTHVPAGERQLFSYVKCDQSVLRGLPDGFAQSSWNISAPELAPGTKVLATWLDAQMQETGYVAATIADGGFFFSHVIVADQPEAQQAAGRMLKAVADYLAPRRGTRRNLAIVYGSASEADRGDGRLVRRTVEEMGSILAAAGLPFTIVSDEAVARGALHDRKLAIFPLNFNLADGEAEAVRQFVAQGGAIVGCFSLNDELARIAGVAEKTFRAGGSETPFQVVAFNSDAPEGVPSSFAQRSSNTMVAVPASDGRVVATWRDGAGNDTAVPAVIMSPHGMFFAYILHAGDLAKTSQFMLATIAGLAGKGFYEPALASLRGSLWDFRRFDTREALMEACRDDQRALEAAERAETLADQAAAQASGGRPLEAYLTLKDARGAAELAFIRSLPCPDRPEFRGTWLHNVSVPNQDWDAHFRGMKERNLNAFLPNVCAAGYAHYQSDFLPTSQFILDHGPQVGPMLEAARRHGIEVHLWRVDFSLWYPGRDVIERYAAENRVCRDPQGEIVGLDRGNATLCPSNPQNQQLEVNCMAEMVRKFHPDGIHFDYIRYPGPQACFCSGCRSRFEERIGRPVENWPDDVLPDGALREQWLQFRRDQITTVVREASKRAREADANVLVSAAVFSNWDGPWGARDGVGQDWPLWVREGYLDFVCPMNYTQNVSELGALVTRQKEWIESRVPLQSGIGAFRSTSAWHTADLVDTARSAGADGLCFFDYRGRVVSEFLPGLLEGPFRNPAKTPWAR